MAIKLWEATKIGTRQEGWWTTYQPLHISTRHGRALFSTPGGRPVKSHIDNQYDFQNHILEMVWKAQCM